ncbi:hypothetical protein E1A91_D13G000200v1 [Gossypium mustelinum]|uniref:Uncharacterized protein n=1 Tax=Gossypium mustelinum TaxID=34275 RepID=A0A5D2RVP3_GOSMU|nr:hypothetical protein E1A91_D13G000200v1 [Gossypium mustelinum]
MLEKLWKVSMLASFKFQSSNDSMNRSKNCKSCLSHFSLRVVAEHILICSCQTTVLKLSLLVFLMTAEGMKLYISDNKVILTEGFDGVVPVKCFEKIESWPDRKPIPFSNV